MVYLADVKETPFISMVNKGKKLINMLYDFECKTRGGRKKGGVPDGKDISAFDSQDPRVILQGRGEVFRRAPMVGFIAQMISQAGGQWNISNNLDESVADQIVEHKRDMEKECWSNQDSRPDDGVNGAQFRGAGRWIYEGTATLAVATNDLSPTTGFYELSIPAANRTPSNQIYTGSVAAMTEDDFGNLIQNKWIATGASAELRGFVSPAVKNRMGTLSRYVPSIAGYTPDVQVNAGRVNGNTLFGASIDVYKSDWGQFTLMPVSTDYLPSAYTAFFLDMMQVKLRVMEMVAQMELPNLGGGPREMIQSIISPTFGDPRAHCKIDGTA